MASRGELSVLRTDEPSDGEPAVEPGAEGESPVVPEPLLPAPPAKLPRGQVLTHLLNEDR